MNQQSTILIVDDSPVMQSILCEVLSRPEYRLILASSGAEALDLAGAHLPDLILLDVMMPEMDGFEVCRRLRADANLAHVPILILTALDDRDSRLAGIRAGADDFLPKPFDHVELSARVRTITRLNRYRHLLSERARFAWVVERAHQGYLIVGEDDEILYANQQARRYLGLPLDERAVVSGGFLARVGQSYLCRPEAAWHNWPHTAKGPCYLVLAETSTTGAFWLRVTRLALPDEGAWMIQLEDVTAEMVQQRDTWRLHRAIYHKLRTPLIGVLNGLQLLTRHAGSLSSPELTAMSELAYSGAQTLHRTVEEVLNFTTAPLLAGSDEGFPLGHMPDLALRLAEDLRIAVVDVAIGASLAERRVRLNPRLVEMIVRELLENALKFHPERQPTVTIAATALCMSQVQITVTDDGLRLSPEQLARIGTPHYQAEKQFTGQVPGFGLGLATIISILWSVGGSLHVANRQPGPGVSVTLTLPLTPRA